MEQQTSFNPLGSRYNFDFDFCTYRKGWAQVDTSQDAPYYGTWCSPNKKQIVTYCEGDITVTTCKSDEEFVAELRRLAEWNRERGYWKGIDPGLTDVFRNRFVDLGVGDLLH